MAQDERMVWTHDQAVEAVMAFLDSDEGSRFHRLFSEDDLAEDDLSAFVSDASRRFECKSDHPKQWWGSVSNIVGGSQAQFLALAEPLSQHGVSLDDLYRALPQQYHSKALVSAYERCRGGHSVWGLPPGITNTKGWSDERIQAKLEEVKVELDWANTTGSARKWWEAFENENSHRRALVLRLAEELANRKATITEFFLAYAYSNTDNIQANLSYLDYTRLKKEEVRKKKEAAQKVGEGLPTEKVTASGFPAPTSYIPPGITNTKGWSDERIREQLEKVKARLDWANTTGSARKWWEAFENGNTHRWAFVLRLAEELANRKATITEFFLAYVYSNTDNIQANLSYLDYTRLKKEEERKKKEAAARAKEAAVTAASPIGNRDIHDSRPQDKATHLD